MKLFFISDIHGSKYYLEKAISQFEKEKADYIIILGDQLYHGPRNPLPKDYNPNECANLLNLYKDKIIAIRGNCDSEVDQVMLKYPILADSSTILIDNKRFFLTHGHIYNKDNMPPLNKGDIFVSGHVHLPIAEIDNDIIFFNPGSISIPRDGNPSSYGIYEQGRLFIKTLEGDEIKSLLLT